MFFYDAEITVGEITYDFVSSGLDDLCFRPLSINDHCRILLIHINFQNYFPDVVFIHISCEFFFFFICVPIEVLLQIARILRVKASLNGVLIMYKLNSHRFMRKSHLQFSQSPVFVPLIDLA